MSSLRKSRSLGCTRKEECNRCLIRRNALKRPDGAPARRESNPEISLTDHVCKFDDDAFTPVESELLAQYIEAARGLSCQRASAAPGGPSVAGESPAAGASSASGGSSAPTESPATGEPSATREYPAPGDSLVPGGPSAAEDPASSGSGGRSPGKCASVPSEADSGAPVPSLDAEIGENSISTTPCGLKNESGVKSRYERRQANPRRRNALRRRTIVTEHPRHLGTNDDPINEGDDGSCGSSQLLDGLSSSRFSELDEISQSGTSTLGWKIDGDSNPGRENRNPRPRRNALRRRTIVTEHPRRSDAVDISLKEDCDDIGISSRSSGTVCSSQASDLEEARPAKKPQKEEQAAIGSAVAPTLMLADRSATAPTDPGRNGESSPLSPGACPGLLPAPTAAGPGLPVPFLGAGPDLPPSPSAASPDLPPTPTAPGPDLPPPPTAPGPDLPLPPGPGRSVLTAVTERVTTETYVLDGVTYTKQTSVTCFLSSEAPTDRRTGSVKF